MTDSVLMVKSYDRCWESAWLSNRTPVSFISPAGIGVALMNCTTIMYRLIPVFLVSLHQASGPPGRIFDVNQQIFPSFYKETGLPRIPGLPTSIYNVCRFRKAGS